MRVRARVPLAVGVSGIFACNAILGIEERPLRAADDAGALDAGAGSETGAPSGPDAGGGAAGPCARAGVVFCDDFDEGGASPSRWDDLRTGAGPIDLDTSEARSAPRSLRVQLSSGSGSRETRIVKTIMTTKQDVTVSFDLRIDGPTSRDFGIIVYANVALLPPPAGKKSHDLWLYEFGPEEPTIAYDQSPSEGEERSSLDPPLAIGRWQNVALRFVGAPAPRAEILLDGVLAGTVPVAPVTLTGVVVSLGADVAEARTTATIRFDDVTVVEQ